MFNKIIKILIIMMLLAGAVTPVSAFSNPINDLGDWISGILTGVQPLTVPIVGSVQVSCADGSTSCKYYGENWHIQTSVIANNQHLVFTLPAGTKWTDSSGTTTSGSTVKFTLTPVNAFQKQRVSPIDKTYLTCWFIACGWAKPIPGYQVAGYSYKEVSINAKIESVYGVNNAPLVYNYASNPTYSMSDGKYTMQFSPSYIVDWGIDMGASSLVYVDDGFGTGNYISFSSSAFYVAHQATEYELYYGGGDLSKRPTNWREYLAYMKSQHGLVQYHFPSGTTLKVTDSNTMVSLEYPYGAVGIVGEILIPKAMATSVTVEIDDGIPQIGTVTVSPNPFTLGSGYITVTVPVQNVGTSSDNFKMTIDQSFGIVSYISNGGTINKGGSAIYSAKITPTVTTSQVPSFTIFVEATGSHEVTSVVKTVNLVASSTTDPKQWVAITTLDPDGKQLPTAPILQNGVQIGTGFKRVELVYGTYEFSTNNVSNPTLFAPNPAVITLSGGAEREVPLKFDTKPQEDDYTWIFWSILVGILLILSWRFGIINRIIANPIITIPIVIIVAAIFLFFNPDIVKSISTLSVVLLYSIVLSLLVVIILAIPLPFIFFNPYIFVGTTLILTLFFMRLMTVIMEVLAIFGIK